MHDPPAGGIHITNLCSSYGKIVDLSAARWDIAMKAAARTASLVQGESLDKLCGCFFRHGPVTLVS